MNARGTGENLRNELVAAATDLLTTAQDVQCPSLRAVARKVGVAPSAVYLHFSSQADLFTAVIHSLIEQLWSAQDLLYDESAEPLERLMQFATAYADWSMAHRGGYQLLFERVELQPLETHLDGAQLTDCGFADSPLAAVTEIRSRVRRICAAAGIAEAEQDAHAMRLWCVIHGVVSLRIHKPNDHWQTTVEHDLRCILGALLTPLVISENPAAANVATIV